MSKAADFADKFKVTKGKDFKLKDWDPSDTLKFDDKEHAEAHAQQRMARNVHLVTREIDFWHDNPFFRRGPYIGRDRPMHSGRSK